MLVPVAFSIARGGRADEYGHGGGRPGDQRGGRRGDREPREGGQRARPPRDRPSPQPAGRRGRGRGSRRGRPTPPGPGTARRGPRRRAGRRRGGGHRRGSGRTARSRPGRGRRTRPAPRSPPARPPAPGTPRNARLRCTVSSFSRTATRDGGSTPRGTTSRNDASGRSSTSNFGSSPPPGRVTGCSTKSKRCTR